MAEKPAMVQLTDRIAGWFVLTVSAIALATFSVWSTLNLAHAVDHTVALLIIACPCALGLATPLALAVAIGRSAQRDILIKSGSAIDHLAVYEHGDGAICAAAAGRLIHACRVHDGTLAHEVSVETPVRAICAAPAVALAWSNSWSVKSTSMKSVPRKFAVGLCDVPAGSSPSGGAGWPRFIPDT